MKKSRLLLLLSVFALSSCDFSFSSLFNKQSDKEEELVSKNENKETEDNTSTNTSSNQNTNSNTNSNTNVNDNTSTNTNTNTDQNQNQNQTDDDENTQEIHGNSAIDISDWVQYDFNDGYDPCYPEGWDFLYGSTHNPGGRLWGTGEHSGAEFVKNCSITSPRFVPDKKIEYHFYFWFSVHNSDSYQATKNTPQFYIDVYNSNATKLGTNTIEIGRSDVPSNNTTYDCHGYLGYETGCYFVLRWGNYIPNGSGGYSAVITRAKLKSWPYPL